MPKPEPIQNQGNQITEKSLLGVQCKTDCIATQIPTEQYFQLKNNPKISKSIGALSQEENNFLQQSISQLEAGTTNSWKEYDAISTLNYDQIRKIWLRRIAFAFYVDLHKLSPVKLENYGQAYLDELLSFCTDSEESWTFAETNPEFHQKYSCNQYFMKLSNENQNNEEYISDIVWDTNPVETWKISNQILQNTQIEKPKDIIDKTILWMRQYNWRHWTIEEWNSMAIHPRSAVNIATLFQERKSGSGSSALFLASIARTWNMPSRAGDYGIGHGYVIFPTLNIGLASGDVIYTARLNVLPVDESYFLPSQLEQWHNDEPCTTWSKQTRTQVSRVLSYYNNPQYNFLIYNQYCTAKDIYVIKLIDLFTPTNCVQETKYDYGALEDPFTQQEIDNWNKLLEEYADEKKIC